MAIFSEPLHQISHPTTRDTYRCHNPHSLSLESFQVHDIGGSYLPQLQNILIEDQLFKPENDEVRHLPALLFSDDKGLKMWSDITRLENYYQTSDEIELLETWGNEIVDELSGICKSNNGLFVVDLGAGDVRKVTPLLRKLDKLGVPITYFALDLSLTSLNKAMAMLLNQEFQNTSCHGLWGSFDHALNFVHNLPAGTPRIFMSLGSMFGNDYLGSAVSLLKTWRGIMRGHDRMLIGMDGTTDCGGIWRSYHDRLGLFDKFIRNGFVASNKVVGVNWYQPADWSLSGKLIEAPYIMHRFVLTAKRDIFVSRSHVGQEDISFPKGQEIECYRAFKLGVEEMRLRFQKAGLKECCPGWKSESGRINQYLLRHDA